MQAVVKVFGGRNKLYVVALAGLDGKEVFVMEGCDNPKKALVTTHDKGAAKRFGYEEARSVASQIKGAKAEHV
jgi:hypothetical protein